MIMKIKMKLEVCMKYQWSDSYQDQEFMVVFGFSDDAPKAADYPAIVKKALDHLAKNKDWKWEAGEVKTIHSIDSASTVYVIGMGKKEETNGFKLRKTAAGIAKALKREECATAAIFLGGLKALWNAPEATRLIIESMGLATYEFKVYKTSKKDKKKAKPCSVGFISKDKVPASVLKEAELAIKATGLARDLVNEPANTLVPTEYAERAIKAGKDYGFEVQIFDENEIRKMKMDAYWSVAMGSDFPPRLIVMRWMGNPNDRDNIIALVGKGLTYDSGGYAIKPAGGMVTMKCDMGGSASVVGAMCMVAKLKLKANVVGVVAACENMISGRAYRNGDIIGSMAGKTIEVGNTDAEGRLTLIDAVTYAIEKEKATRVVDIATLTGAAVVALGKVRIGVLSNNDELYHKLEEASDYSGERVWRLPHDEEYREQLKSDIADIKNVGGRGAGTVTAGLFIRDFVQDKPWLHLDIAGKAFIENENTFGPSGATGCGVRLLYSLVKTLV